MPRVEKKHFNTILYILHILAWMWFAYKKGANVEYHCEIINNVEKVSLEGRLVAACSEEFKAEMFDRLAGQKKVVFDLSKMAHIDSSGLGVLVSILQWLNANGGIIKLACLQPRPKNVFDITHVCRLFEIYDTVDAALASFNAPT